MARLPAVATAVVVTLVAAAHTSAAAPAPSALTAQPAPHATNHWAVLIAGSNRCGGLAQACIAAAIRPPAPSPALCNRDSTGSACRTTAMTHITRAATGAAGCTKPTPTRTRHIPHPTRAQIHPVGRPWPTMLSVAVTGEALAACSALVPVACPAAMVAVVCRGPPSCCRARSRWSPRHRRARAAGP